jgi:cytochrome c-type biogenesis protein CcmH
LDIDALRQALQQLKQEHAQGKLPKAAYETRRAELERQLVEQVMRTGVAAATGATQPMPTSAVEDAPAKPSRALLLGVGAWVIAATVAGYAWMGSPGLIGAVAPPPAAAAPQPGLEQIAAMVDKLAARLREKPDDAVGWMMLARSYSVLGRNAEALPAYQQAVALKPDDAGLLADYAAELATQNQRQFTGRPLELVERALSLDPNNLKALSLSGVAAFDRKDYALAVQQWEKILKLAPADTDLVQQVQASVAEARELGKLPPAVAASAVPAMPTPAATAAAPSVPGDTTVSGRVTLSAAIAAKAAPDDTVFIFARAAEGPRMPLAVLRKQVKDLPLDFKLDDSLAMSPAARLSMHPRVVVSARISKSGNAIAQPGDLVGTAEPVAIGASGVKIDIAQTVPN